MLSKLQFALPGQPPIKFAYAQDSARNSGVS